MMSTYVPPRGVYAGIDVGGTKTAAIIVDEKGNVVGSADRNTRPGPEGVIASIIDAIAQARFQGGVVATPRAVGIGIPGAVDPLRGVVGRAVNVGLDGFGLAEAMSEAMGIPVGVDNDVTLAALGVASVRDDSPSLAFVNVGTGFGVGVVIDGVPLRGWRGAAGEIGHLPFDPRGRRCGCGLVGCIELSASGSALQRAAGTAGVPQLFVDAAAGNPSSIAVIKEFCAALALGLRIVVQAYDVDTVALGGGVFASASAFMPQVVEILAADARSSAFVRDLHIADRLSVVDRTVPYATLGAARWVMKMASHVV